MIKTIRNMLAPALSGFFIFRFGGESSSSSSSSSTNTSNATDNRLAIGNGSIGASTGGIVSLSDMRDQSTSLNVSDSSNRSQTDNSNRSVNNSGNTTTVDPGALKAMERAILSNEAVSREAMATAQEAASSAASVASRSASDSLSRAFSFASDADATNKSGFSKLLDVGLSMFDSNVKAVQNAQSLTAQAYQTATAEKAGSLDNKTIATLGMAAAAVVALFAFRK